MDRPSVTRHPSFFPLRFTAAVAVALTSAMPAAGPAAPGASPRAAPVSVATPALPDGRDVVVAAAGSAPTAPAPPPPPAPDSPAHPGPAPGARYAWPLRPPPAVRAPFRAPAHPYGRGHRGVDLGAEPGRPVLAARAGTVLFAGPVAGRGVVSVGHDDGLRTTYQPVRPLVRAGAPVAAGQVIGSLEPGLAGCPDPACLHWGVRRGPAEYLDPLVLLRPRQVGLLPVPEPWPLETSPVF